MSDQLSVDKNGGNGMRVIFFNTFNRQESLRSELKFSF